MDRDDSRDPGLAGHIKNNVGSAALGAACLIFFGYFWGLLHPTGTDAFSIGNLLFYYALRIGGPAMGVIALLSLAGIAVSLALDAVVSIAIGLALGAGGILMLAGGGWGPQSILTVVFAFLFIRAGWHNGRVYFAYAGREHKPSAPPTSQPVPRESTDSASLAGRLREARMSGDAVRPAATSTSHAREFPSPADAASVPSPSQTSMSSIDPSRPSAPAPAPSPMHAEPTPPAAPASGGGAAPAPSESSPQGFLASFAPPRND